ncbi:hypothetical protein [Gloeocapsopsis dulcis]|nr:hypothetical protein [Gloeocapsopsis dulcis]WNN88150.1 hypothetical protein P0S91_17865 [Gloeocapsopsis dulcis]
MSLTLGAMDELNSVIQLQELLEISMEQADESPEKRWKRVELLTETYLAQVEPCLENLVLKLERIRQQLSADKINASSD